nr:hypothetical protein [Tanacetum cinerariifolium]
IPVEDEVFPAEEQPLPADALPTTDSPGYIYESDPDEDPEDDDDEDLDEDPADYPTDHNDDDKEQDEEPFGDDADEEDEEQDEDDDEEEEHSASADSIPPLPAPYSQHHPLSSSYHYLLHHHPYSCYLLTVELIDLRLPCHLKREDVGYGIRDAWIDPRDIAKEEALTTLKGVNTRVTELAAVQEQDTQDIYEVMEDRVETLVDDSRYHYETGRLVDQEARCSREAWAYSIGRSSAFHGHLVTALGEIQALQAREKACAGAPEGAGSST